MSFNNNNKQQINKPIIKLSPQQVFRQILANTQMNNQPLQAPPMSPSLNTTLRGPEKTCGLFDTDLFLKNLPLELDTENMQFINDSKDSNEFEECEPLTDFLLNNFGNQILNLPDMDDTQLVANNENIKPKSKFAKKVEEANLRISMPTNSSANKTQTKSADLNSAIAMNGELNNMLTPSIEKTFSNLLQSIPTGDLMLNEDQNFLTFLDIDPPFVKTDDMIGNLTPQETQPQSEDKIASVITIDHPYVKPKDVFMNDELTNDSFMSEAISDRTQASGLLSSDSLVSSKKKRQRGVYRKDDIRNEEDLMNYLQRRKKNNISSKMSRANKKAVYQEIDSKIDFLFSSNKKLTTKIAKLENINKIIKDMLVDRLAKSSAT